MIQADDTFLLLERRMINSGFHPGVLFCSNTKDFYIHTQSTTGIPYTKLWCWFLLQIQVRMLALSLLISLGFY
jgi:hypothetical protein